PGRSAGPGHGRGRRRRVCLADADGRPAGMVPGARRYPALARTGRHTGRRNGEGEGIKIIRPAVDAGVLFVDNSRDDHDGVSEVRMGEALKDGCRQTPGGLEDPDRNLAGGVLTAWRV